MHQLLAQERSDFDLAAMIVLVDMLPADEHADVATLAARLEDDRASWFHDPNRRVGEVIGASLGGKGNCAWDVYLFYKADVEWHDVPPAPEGWVHQLSDAWADPTRRRHGKDLDTELVTLLRTVGGRPSPD